MSKKKNRRAIRDAQNLTIAELQRQLDEAGGRVTVIPPTFDNLEICWSKRTVKWGGRTITTDGETDYFVMPIPGRRYVIEDTFR